MNQSLASFSGEDQSRMAQSQLRILVVDDDISLAQGVKNLLGKVWSESPLAIQVAYSFEEAFSQLEIFSPELLLLDVRLPSRSGLELLEEVKKISPRTFVVMMTAHGNISDAIRSVQLGAYDYLEKPVRADKLREIIQKSLEARAMVEGLWPTSPIFDDDIDSDLVGQSDRMKEVFRLIQKLSQVDTSVLIRGENGTGKELVARAIHFNSPRKKGPFLAVNCGAIPENLLESEFFGHEKGSFTGATERKIGKLQAANSGTLFLDEIGELKPSMQVKLLRVLQDKTFTPLGSVREVKAQVRIIAATNRNLEQMMMEGEFREDLFFRLSVMPVFLPPLRERPKDILSLCHHFLSRKKNELPQSRLERISPEALIYLQKYPWPGNIRELENTIERAMILASGEELLVEHLPPQIVQGENRLRDKPQEIPLSLQHLDFDEFKEVSEREFIVRALKANQGRINQTVAKANIPKNTLLRKIRKYGIDPTNLESN